MPRLFRESGGPPRIPGKLAVYSGVMNARYHFIYPGLPEIIDKVPFVFLIYHSVELRKNRESDFSSTFRIILNIW